MSSTAAGPKTPLSWNDTKLSIWRSQRRGSCSAMISLRCLRADRVLMSIVNDCVVGEPPLSRTTSLVVCAGTYAWSMSAKPSSIDVALIGTPPVTPITKRKLFGWVKSLLSIGCEAYKSFELWQYGQGWLGKSNCWGRQNLYIYRSFTRCFVRPARVFFLVIPLTLIVDSVGPLIRSGPPIDGLGRSSLLYGAMCFAWWVA